MEEGLFVKRNYRAGLLFGILVMLFPMLQAQEKPPFPVEVEVRNARFLNFGTFTGGEAGGTVSIDYSGVRSQTGDVFLLNFGASPTSAMFDLRANPGTLISISGPTDFYLYGDGGTGGQIRLEIDSFSTGQTFITTVSPPAITEILVGGTLYIGNDSQSPPGFYSGSYTLIFNYE